MASTQVTGAGREPVGIGRVLVWPGGSLWAGRSVGMVPEHAHHAIQVSLALEGRFRVSVPAWPQARETVGMLVMPDQRHSIDGGGATLATLFVEPNSFAGAALRARFAATQVALLGDDEAESCATLVRGEFLSGAADRLLSEVARAAICCLAGEPPLAPRTDPRISAALTWMHQRLASALRLHDVAARVHLSPGRFRHLFVAQTGTSFRAWLLWARAEHAIAAANRGLSWTAAAQEAGFADAAHFTRTCRRVFGIAPTMLAFEGSVP